jgi:hypothetical protein
MEVKEVYVEDYTSGKEYQWTDRSGSWQSIKVIKYVLAFHECRCAN